MNAVASAAALPLVPALFLIWAVLPFARARASSRWPTADATIVESRVVTSGRQTKPRVVFEYEIGGRRYAGRRVQVGPTFSTSGGFAQWVVDTFPRGARVRAAVNPAHADDAVLEPGVRAFHLVLVVAAMIALAVAVLVVWITRTTT